MSVGTISVVIPVLNEEASIDRLLDDLEAQSLKPCEILIVDAGSTDDTPNRLEERRALIPELRSVQVPGARPGRGRNVGARESRGDIIAFTDAGLRLEETWLEELTRPFTEGACEAALGSFVSDGESHRDRCTELLVCCDAFDVNAGGEPVYMPTSASLAIRRSAWNELEPFPEDLRACEDSLFFQRLLDGRARIGTAPRATVRWHIGRGLRYVWVKAREEGRGLGRAGWVSRRAVFVSVLYTALGLFPLLGGSLVFSAALIVGGLHWRRRRLRRKNPRAFSRIQSLWISHLYLPLLAVWSDAAHLLGWGRGFLERWWRRGGWPRRPRFYRPVSVPSAPGAEVDGKR